MLQAGYPCKVVHSLNPGLHRTLSWPPKGLKLAEDCLDLVPPTHCGLVLSRHHCSVRFTPLTSPAPLLNLLPPAWQRPPAPPPSHPRTLEVGAWAPETASCSRENRQWLFATFMGVKGGVFKKGQQVSLPRKKIVLLGTKGKIFLGATTCWLDIVQQRKRVVERRL